MGTKRTGNLPNRGKLLAPIEKAPCPCWASTVPNSEPKQTKIPNRHLAKKTDNTMKTKSIRTNKRGRLRISAKTSEK